MDADDQLSVEEIIRRSQQSKVAAPRVELQRVMMMMMTMMMMITWNEIRSRPASSPLSVTRLRVSSVTRPTLLTRVSQLMSAHATYSY